MTISKVEWAGEKITRFMNGRAKVIWGCSINPDYENYVRVMLIFIGARSKYKYG